MRYKFRFVTDLQQNLMLEKAPLKTIYNAFTTLFPYFISKFVTHLQQNIWKKCNAFVTECLKNCNTFVTECLKLQHICNGMFKIATFLCLFTKIKFWLQMR